MKQKIEWYQEVLDLEPGSKVFFPLARMQAEDGQPEAALATLRRGLSRNPEHVEARLLLIELLFGQGNFDSLAPEVDQLAAILGGYPGFWSAWTTHLSKNPASRDVALALSFLSSNLRGQTLSWSDVIEQGLSHQLSGNTVPKVVAVAVPKSVAPQAEPAKKQENQELDFNLTADNNDEVDSADEDQFSLKTRSMAEVLAEQGDYAGALDIYEELLGQTSVVEEKTELEVAIANVTSKISMASVAVRGDAESALKTGPVESGKGRLLEVLEVLARRLEAKS